MSILTALKNNLPIYLHCVHACKGTKTLRKFVSKSIEGKIPAKALKVVACL